MSSELGGWTLGSTRVVRRSLNILLGRIRIVCDAVAAPLGSWKTASLREVVCQILSCLWSRPCSEKVLVAIRNEPHFANCHVSQESCDGTDSLQWQTCWGYQTPPADLETSTWSVSAGTEQRRKFNSLIGLSWIHLARVLLEPKQTRWLGE